MKITWKMNLECTNNSHSVADLRKVVYLGNSGRCLIGLGLDRENTNIMGYNDFNYGLMRKFKTDDATYTSGLMNLHPHT